MPSSSELVGNINNFFVAPHGQRGLKQTDKKQVIMGSPDLLRDYMLRHPDMIEIATRITTEAEKLFPQDSHFSLEYFQDPDGEDEHLVFYIRQQKYDEDILEKIEMIWDAINQHLSRSTGWILVTTDFQPPGI